MLFAPTSYMRGIFGSVPSTKKSDDSSETVIRG